MIKIKTLLKEDFANFGDKIVQFYAPRYSHPFTKATVENSAIICLAYDGENIVGGVRAISDLSRHALIVDLVVRKAYRRQKIGSLLMESVIVKLKEYDVKNIGLTTEPGIDWLPSLYKKLGFVPLEKSEFMEYKRITNE